MNLSMIQQLSVRTKYSRRKNRETPNASVNYKHGNLKFEPDVKITGRWGGGGILLAEV